ncbi:carboxylesterase family protein [soil metagenome]
MTDSVIPTRSTREGDVLGLRADGIDRFFGIPYAAPPFGVRRFELPQPAEPWNGPRDATRPGPNAPQNPRPDGFPPVASPLNTDEGDILSLNMWAPADAAPGTCPVIFWIHGGALHQGANSEALTDGSRFAAGGAVVVAANYRLGAEGFSVLGGAPLNLGLEDVLAALRWVHDEISSFGGDPTRITIVGQSAGGVLAAALMASPSAQGMFQRVIVQSGPLEAQPADEAGAITRLMAEHLGIAPTKQAFAAIAPQQLLESQAAAISGGIPGVTSPGFQLAIDETLVPTSPGDALIAGVAADVELLIGVCAEEHRLYMAPTGMLDLVTDELLDLLLITAPFPDLNVYRAAMPDARPGDLAGTLLSDVTLRGPMLEAADARAAAGATTYVYEFAWRSPSLDLGAAHAVDLPYVFHTLNVPDSQMLVGDTAPTELADAMNGAWLRFAAGADPGWPRWDQRRPTKVFDGATNPIESDRDHAVRVALLAALAERRT